MAELQIKLYNYERRRTYAPRISDAKWEAIRPVIDRMFQNGMTHAAILLSLEKKYMFKVSKGQLVDRLQKWELNNYKPRLVKSGCDRAPVKGLDVQSPRWRTVYYDTLCTHIKFHIKLPTSLDQSKYLDWRTQQRTILKCFGTLLYDIYRLGVGRNIQRLHSVAISRDSLSGEAYAWVGIARRKVIASTAERRIFQGEVLQDLRSAFTNMTDLDRCDLGLYHVVLCLAFESALHGDKERFVKHRDMACHMLQGILHYWGEGGNAVFSHIIRTFLHLEDIQVGTDVPYEWLQSVLLGIGDQDLRAEMEIGPIHGCIQYDCEVEKGSDIIKV